MILPVFGMLVGIIIVLIGIALIFQAILEREKEASITPTPMEEISKTLANTVSTEDANAPEENQLVRKRVIKKKVATTEKKEVKTRNGRKK